MGRKESFRSYKARLRDIIVEERDIGYLDPGIEDIISGLNRLGGIATVSTCIGRVSIVEARRPWERGEEASRVVYKTHGVFSEEALVRVLSLGLCNLWLKASGPIMHVRVSDVGCALHILKYARSTGFKHSGIISLGGERGVVVELMSAMQIAVPLRLECRDLVYPGREHMLVELADSTVKEGRSRLRELVNLLTSDPGPCS